MPIAGKPSTLIGIPFDRPVVGYGGKTINTLRLWAAAAPDYFDFQRIQPRRFRRRAGRDAGRRIAHARAVSRRFDQPRAGTALRAGVFPGRLFAGRSGAPLPARQRRLERAAREGRHPAQRHAPHDGRAGADADPAGRGATGLGPGLGPHAAGRWLTPTTRCCPKRWRNGRSSGSRCCCRAIWKSFTRSTAGFSTTCAPAFPATKAASQRISLIEEGPAQASPHGQPGHRRLAQHQRRGRDPFGAAAHDDRQGSGRDVPRALQQQDQRRHAAALAAAGQPGAGARRSPRPSATAGSPTSAS